MRWPLDRWHRKGSRSRSSIPSLSPQSRRRAWGWARCQVLAPIWQENTDCANSTFWKKGGGLPAWEAPQTTWPRNSGWQSAALSRSPPRWWPLAWALPSLKVRAQVRGGVYLGSSAILLFPTFPQLQRIWDKERILVHLLAGVPRQWLSVTVSL